MVWCHQATTPLPEPMLAQIYVTMWSPWTAMSLVDHTHQVHSVFPVFKGKIWYSSLVTCSLILNFQQSYQEYFEHILWKCSQENDTRPHCWLINIGSDNGLVPSATRPWLKLSCMLPYGVTKPLWINSLPPKICGCKLMGYFHIYLRDHYLEHVKRNYPHFNARRHCWPFNTDLDNHLLQSNNSDLFY